MDQNQTLERLRGIVQPYVKNLEAFEKLDMETRFIQDLDINSANLVDIVLDVEEAFGIEIDNASMERMLDVKAALEIIETKVSEK